MAKVDTHAERVTAAWSDALRCRLGCTACCRQDLHVSRVEADHIAAWLRAADRIDPPDPSLGPHDDHGRFAELSGGRRACAFLGSGGACTIYEVRPIICRSHGLPVRADETTDACPLNFETERTAAGELDIADDDVLSLDTTNVILAAVDQLYCAQTDADPEREALSSVAARIRDLA